MGWLDRHDHKAPSSLKSHLAFLTGPSISFPQMGEYIPPTTKPPVEKKEHFSNFSPGRNSFPKFFLEILRLYYIHRKIKSLIEKILRYLPIFSAIIQFLPP